ncbi:MAG: MoaD/ThiS family protein [Deltaproteobacteria bacterium]|nr:MoaD/ThiS family protein [Deltaproteobacteria bacterium]
MKVRIKLFSVLREYVQDYNPQSGVEAELKDGATVADLLRHLKIPISKAPVVTCKSHIMNTADIIQKDSNIEIFQTVAGG